MTPDQVIEKTKRNLLAMRGTDFASLVEQEPSAMNADVRWWRGATLDLVRTADGAAWLFLPLGFAEYPPLFGSAYPNAPGQIIEHLTEGGGAVMFAELPLGKTLELRLVASRRGR